MELKDLWQLDKQHSAETISEKFFPNVDRYLLPTKTINLYMEKRRVSLLNTAVNGANENFHQASLSDRRRSTQSALGVGKPIDGHQMYISGLTAEKTNDFNKKRRASEGNGLRNDHSDSENITLTEQITEDSQSLKLSKHHQPEPHSTDEQGKGLIHQESTSVPENELPFVDENLAHQTNATESSAKKPTGILVATSDSELKSSKQPCLTSATPEKLVETDVLKDVEVEIRGGRHRSFKSKRDGCSRCGHCVRCLCCVRRPARSGILRALLATFWRPLLWSSLLKLSHDILVFANPNLLNRCSSTWFRPRIPASSSLHCKHSVVKGCLPEGVLSKDPLSLRLSNSARRDSTTGQIMNLISSDAQHFVQLLPFLNIIWSGPFQIIVAIVFLWRELGPSVLAGVGVLLLLLPLNAVSARVSKKLQVR
ncbi:unnamed protein product [Echinostoma caproni]|uniref:ABC transmembrane type-1 domain-containing protein n=1 Tax=Echinostoma caproni TaxID=27848 RepID=A0A3P8L1X3_9TREM|nr:unnamed protein product [Echinostoma caproni]